VNWPGECLHVLIPTDALQAVEEHEAHDLAEPAMPRFELRDTAMVSLMELIIRELQGGGPRSRLLLDSLENAIASTLFRALGEARPKRAFGLNHAKLRRVITFMESDFAEDIGLAELAKVAQLSPNHFVQAFRDATGVPPYRWLMNLRIERAKEMLRLGQASVTTVGLACGFGSAAHFSTAFRRHEGVSPQRWRREC
jgi:transcriptional regulator GlxA family with amidase domain